MNQADPLALYVRATRPHPAQKPKPASAAYTYSQQPLRSKNGNRKSVGFLAYLIATLFVIAVIIFISKVL